MNLLHSCKQVAQLLTRAHDEPLGVVDRLRLRMHLAMCGNCNNVAKQLDAESSFGLTIVCETPTRGGLGRVVALGGDLKPRAVDHTITATTELVPSDDPLKRGHYGTHVVYSDEPPSVGGGDTWPPPLGYAALAIGF